MSKQSVWIQSRMGPCNMCKLVEAKYRCPECELVTCSVLCINKHKKEFDCSGIRNKTNFVPLKKMNELHLLSDYRLLEEVSRVAEANSRVKINRFTRKDAPLPHHLQKFRSAISRRNSRIYFLPGHFAKHKENTTILDWKTNHINWRLKVIFLHARKFCLPVTKCSEDVVLETVIDKCLAASANRNKELRKHFEAYQHARNDIQVLLQAEKIPGAQQRMFILENKKTLKENLEGKRIVEFPVLYVVLKGFYGSESLKDPCKEMKRQVKTENLLISNYSLANNKNELSSDDEDSNAEDEKGNESEDYLDEALESLGSVSNVLSSLYKQAMDNS